MNNIQNSGTDPAFEGGAAQFSGGGTCDWPGDSADNSDRKRPRRQRHYAKIIGLTLSLHNWKMGKAGKKGFGKPGNWQKRLKAAEKSGEKCLQKSVYKNVFWPIFKPMPVVTPLSGKSCTLVCSESKPRALRGVSFFRG
jgi:hypothetical protein